jgi:hypothetical protein
VTILAEKQSADGLLTLRTDHHGWLTSQRRVTYSKDGPKRLRKQ